MTGDRIVRRFSPCDAKPVLSHPRLAVENLLHPSPTTPILIKRSLLYDKRALRQSHEVTSGDLQVLLRKIEGGTGAEIDLKDIEMVKDDLNVCSLLRLPGMAIGDTARSHRWDHGAPREGLRLHALHGQRRPFVPDRTPKWSPSHEDQFTASQTPRQ